MTKPFVSATPSERTTVLNSRGAYLRPGEKVNTFFGGFSDEVFGPNKAIRSGMDGTRGEKRLKLPRAEFEWTAKDIIAFGIALKEFGKSAHIRRSSGSKRLGSVVDRCRLGVPFPG